MSYQTVFREAVGEIPPTSIDVEQVIRQQRQQRRRHRLATLVAAAVLGVAVPLAIVGGSGPDLPTSSSSPSPTAQPARTPRPEPGKTFSTNDLAVFAALEHEAPDVEWITKDWPSDGDVVTWNPVNSTKLYFGQGPIRAGDRTGYFSLQVEQDWDRRVVTCIPEKTQGKSCVDSTGPAGEKIRTASSQVPITSSPKNRSLTLRGMPTAPTSDRFSTHYGIAVERSDGTRLIATMAADGENPPLTLAQLTAVALDPALTLD